MNGVSLGVVIAGGVVVFALVLGFIVVQVVNQRLSNLELNLPKIMVTAPTTATPVATAEEVANDDDSEVEEDVIPFDTFGSQKFAPADAVFSKRRLLEE